MALKQHLSVKGLATDPNRLGVADDGALIFAREVVIRRNGFVEPRPGFGLENTEDVALLADLKALIPFGSDVLHVGSDVEGDGDPYNAVWPIAEQPVRDGAAAALQWETNARRGAEARKNLYLTTADGVRRLMTTEDENALRAGLLPPTLTFAESGGAGDAVPNGSTVAYRAIFEVTLANGLVLRSAPSGRVIYVNGAGSDQVVDVWAGGAPATPEIPDATVELKIYRSISDVVDNPPDELFLARSVLAPVEAITAYEDATLDVNLGEALYTNTKQEGIARQNIRPPACKDIALFNKSLFFANITRHARTVVSWAEGGDVSASATGIGRRTYDGTRTNASTDITGLSSVVGLAEGQMLSNRTGWAGTNPVYIVEIDSDTLIMSEEWEGATDGAPVSLTFVDTLWVIPFGEAADDGAFAVRADQLFSTIEGINLGQTAAGGGAQANGRAFAVGVSDTSRVNDNSYVPPEGLVSVLIEGISALDGFAIAATHGGEYTPPLDDWEDIYFNPDEVVIETGTRMEPEILPNGIAWTKSDQPEHHMLGAVELVGHQTSGLERIEASKNALWLFKMDPGDGHYRLSGLGELNGWRVDKQDTDKAGLNLLSPELVTSYDGTAYCWSTHGLMAISDAGAVPVSRDYIGKDTAPYELVSGYAGAFAVTNHKTNELIFGLANSEGNDSGLIVVVNLKTGAFTTWFHENPAGFCCAAYHDEQLLFGTTDSGWARVERPAGDNWDLEHAIDIVNVDDETLVIELTAPNADWDPAVGDAIEQDDAVSLITAVESTTSFTVASTTGFDVGAATARVGYSSMVAWLPKTGEGPGVLKRYQEVITHWDSRVGVRNWAVQFNAFVGLGNAASQEYSDVDNYTLSERPYDHRALLGRNVSMATRLLPGVVIRQAGSQWRVGGITLVSEPISTRVSR